VNIELKKLYKIRARHAKLISTLINGLPFVRCIILTGSMVSGDITPQSDIDFLIIAKTGRIFSVRFFTNILVWATGLKRSSREGSNPAGKICLNYYMTEGFLIVPHHRDDQINRYCARSYSNTVLLAGDRAIYNKFIKMNEMWIKKYIEQTSTEILHRKNTENKQFSLSNHLSLRAIDQRERRGNLAKELKSYKLKPVFENLLCGKFGDKLEQRFKIIQLKRIYSDPRTRRYPDLIFANDREMRFHPRKGAN